MKKLRKLDPSIEFESTYWQDTKRNFIKINPIRDKILPLLLNPPQHREERTDNGLLIKAGSLNLEMMLKFLPLITGLKNAIKEKSKKVLLEQTEYDLLMETINANTDWGPIDLGLIEYLKSLKNLPQIEVEEKAKGKSKK